MHKKCPKFHILRNNLQKLEIAGTLLWIRLRIMNLQLMKNRQKRRFLRKRIEQKQGVRKQGRTASRTNKNMRNRDKALRLTAVN